MAPESRTARPASRSRTLGPSSRNADYIVDDKINHFSAASLLDLEITDWSQATYDTAPNFMQRFAAEANRVPDNNQCQNINSDQTIFRADP